MYSPIILEYAKNPVNRGPMNHPTLSYFEENRTCGDAITVHLKIENNHLVDFRFEGDTAIVTTACASIIGEALTTPAMTLDAILTLTESFVQEVVNSLISPRRRNASVLALLAVRNAIHTFRNDGITDDFSDIFEE